MKKGERLALFIVVILFSIALGLSAMLVKIGYNSFVTAREAKETEEAEKANRWGDEPKHDTKVPVDPVYVQPMDPNAGPQGANPDNADYGGGSNGIAAAVIVEQVVCPEILESVFSAV